MCTPYRHLLSVSALQQQVLCQPFMDRGLKWYVDEIMGIFWCILFRHRAQPLNRAHHAGAHR
jgi:hypothetical protein